MDLHVASNYLYAFVSLQAVTAGGTLWAMDRSTFRRIVLKSAFQKRKMYESLLEKVPLLTSLSVIEIEHRDCFMVDRHSDESYHSHCLCPDNLTLNSPN